MQGALKSLCSFKDAEANNKKKAESMMRQALHAYVMAELCPPTSQICMLKSLPSSVSECDYFWRQDH